MNDMQNKKSVLSDGKYILIAMILVFAVGGGILYYFWNKEEAIPIPSVSNEITHNKETRGEEIAVAPEEKWETYTTFSSPKADFTFEYPSMWVYSEDEVENTVVWRFYLNSKKDLRNIILEVHFPTYEIVDFCSNDTRESIYQLNTFSTNDPETYITYEQCGGEYRSAYIYWQKGKYFANASDIKDYRKINLMIFYSGTENKENMNIIQRIAQSIKIK